MARNNLPPESQQYLNQRDATIDQLRSDVTLLKSQDVGAKVDRLAQAVGRLSTKIVPFSFPEIPKVAGINTTVQMPDFDERYEWALISGELYSLTEFQTSAARDCSVSAIAWWDGDSPPGIGWSNSSRFRTPTSFFSIASFNFQWAFDLRTVFTPDYTWTVDVEDEGVYDPNFQPGNNSFYTFTGSILYFQETI